MKFTWRRALPIFVGLSGLGGDDRGARPSSRCFRADAAFRLRHSAARRALGKNAPPQVRIVDIDDQSLEAPRPMAVVALDARAMISALQDLGASLSPWTSCSRNPTARRPRCSPRNGSRSFGWRAPAGASSALPDYDDELAAAFERGRVVTGFGLLAGDNGLSPAIKASFATIGGDPDRHFEEFSRRDSEPSRACSRRRRATAVFPSSAGRDQIIRRLAAARRFQRQTAPSLALEALRVAEDEDTDRRAGRAQRRPRGTGHRLYRRMSAPMRRRSIVDGALILHHGAAVAGKPDFGLASARSRDSARTWRARSTAISCWSGRAPSAFPTLRSTPLNPLEPGVNLHARALEQILCASLPDPAGLGRGRRVRRRRAAGDRARSAGGAGRRSGRRSSPWRSALSRLHRRGRGAPFRSRAS